MKWKTKYDQQIFVYTLFMLKEWMKHMKVNKYIGSFNEYLPSLFVLKDILF